MMDALTEELHPIIDFDRIKELETIQSLWSGYGALMRVKLEGAAHDSVIVKRIAPPAAVKHPRGWNSDNSHQRKLNSYAVEMAWYRIYNSNCDAQCRTATLLGSGSRDGASLLVLEDLDAAGFPLRKSFLTRPELKHCLSWLAAFHGRFIHKEAPELWPTGTYWHLDTRPDEFNAMAEGDLKQFAHAIDRQLSHAQFQTLVHGDAKFANFCFAKNGAVAAVDFQYVGRGCGMKDVAYLLSCMEGGITGDAMEADLLNHYFSMLKHHLQPFQTAIDFPALEQEWRRLYPIAWADFERFLQGWAPGHWKSSAYSARQVQAALKALRC